MIVFRVILFLAIFAAAGLLLFLLLKWLFEKLENKTKVRQAKGHKERELDDEEDEIVIKDIGSKTLVDRYEDSDPDDIVIKEAVNKLRKIRQRMDKTKTRKTRPTFKKRRYIRN